MAQKPATKRRKAIPLDVRVQVLTESGYRCAVPVCRGIIVLDMHHVIHVSEGGPDTPGGGTKDGPRGSYREPRDTAPTLSDAGIDKKLSARAQKYAAIPQQEFENILSDRRERIEQENERVTVNLLDFGSMPMRHSSTTGEIARESIAAWKLMLVSLNNAFDAHTIDDLIFLSTPEAEQLLVSGDGVLKFSRLIASGFASCKSDMRSGFLVYQVYLTDRGRQLLAAWRTGDRGRVEKSLIENPLSPLYTAEGRRQFRASRPPGSTKLGFTGD